MASIEQNPLMGGGTLGGGGFAPDTAQTANSSPANPLNRLLTHVYTLDWATIFYLGVFVIAILTRLIGLGDRVMSHDESLHTTYSYNLWKQGIFQHTPLMHGPVLFHAVAFFYFLFGDSNFTARLYPAVLGIMLVMMPRVLFERWLGKRGAMVASVMLLISPMVLYHNRYIREDTPSIFFTLIMVYAIFRYVDGIRRGEMQWLVVLSGATLLGLASKEVGFMYIAIFGSFLTLYWLIQVLQGVVSGEIQPIVGQVLGAVSALAAVGGGAFLVGGAVSDNLTARGIALPHIVAQVIVLLVFAGVVTAFRKPLLQILHDLSERANSTLYTLITGIVLGGVAALVMIAIINVVGPKGILPDVSDPNYTSLITHLVLWTGITAIVLLAAVIGTASLGFFNIRRRPLLDFLAVVVIALATAALLIYQERKSFIPPTPTTVQNNVFIVLSWIVGVVAIGGLLYLRFATPFFAEMKRYKVFDTLVVMGTLVLPWLTPIPMYLAGYQLDQYPASAEMINAGVIAIIPFIAVAVVGGLCWNPAVWIACAATFYSLFAFFYTTVFTNPQGLVSGVIGSLGYWLKQQEVRRASQPQYYYLLVELPVYEYLPMIGALVTGVVGLAGFWRFRAARYAETAQALPLDQDQLIHTSGVSDRVDSAAMVDSATNAMPMMPVTEMPVTETYDADATNAIPLSPQDNPYASTSEPLPSDLLIEPIAAPPPPARFLEMRNGPEWLDKLPFLGFTAYWAVLITWAFTISGEKMPWLTTHLSIPMIFLTGWFLGTVLDKVEWPQFFKQGWSLLVLTPILLIALANVFGAFIFGNRPFAGLERDQLLQTGVWFAALLVAFLVLYAISLIMARVGWRQTLRTMFVGVFLLLGVLTARTAWRFAFIDYDYATEFGVYAHGAPAMQTVVDKLQELSKQTADGNGIKVAYDDDVSWPGSWYFRSSQFPHATFIGNTTGAADLETYDALLVSQNHATTVEPQLGDKFYKYNFIRLWWPMQDYFDLTPARIDNVFAGVDAPDGGVSGPALRQGLWSIWWDRDYKAYADATHKDLSISQWPVADHMVFFVRKDIAAQVWDMGVGGATASAALPADAFAKLSCTTCAAAQVIGTKGPGVGQFDHLHGMTLAPTGNLLVADSLNARIAVVNPAGTMVDQFGSFADLEKGAAPGGTFREPWSIATGADGMIYVADTWNHRVQVFTADHQFVRMWGHFEVANGQTGTTDGLFGPRDILVDAQNHVYVADTGNKRIRVYNNDGTFLYNIGTAGAAQGQLNEPVGMALDPKTGRLYVADTWNHRIEVFTTQGTFVSTWPVPSWNGASQDTGNRPFLALDATGTRLFVTEPDISRILVWDVSAINAQGGQQALLAFGSKGGADTSHFDALGGLLIDAHNNLYVADVGNSRILRFDINALPGLVPPIPVVPLIPVTDAPTNNNTF